MAASHAPRKTPNAATCCTQIRFSHPKRRRPSVAGRSDCGIGSPGEAETSCSWPTRRTSAEPGADQASRIPESVLEERRLLGRSRGSLPERARDLLDAQALLD